MAVRDALSAETKAFLVRYITSVEELEILSVMVAHAQRTWSVSELDDLIKSNPKSVKMRLDAMVRNGLLEQCGQEVEHYVLTRSPESTLRDVTALVGAYRSHRVEVIERIFNKPSKGITSFANSFKFKGDNHG